MFFQMESFPHAIKQSSPSRVSSFSSPTTDWTTHCIQQTLQDTLPEDASDVSVTRDPIFSVMKKAASVHSHAGPASLQPAAGPVAASTTPGPVPQISHAAGVTADNGSATMSPAAAQFLRSVPDLWYMLVPPVVESARE
jgi:hypothetical protein